ncbi:RNA-binding protein [Comamonas sp.]|uniref:RNA recognition motif domain-containing protein n=1 Tax=Comamonas sp. TaxID=34028 RepID=UPI0025892167|nr:RNA-binding protein [Comamonas sp.]
MGSKLYVGNLPYGVREQDLQQAFAQFGSVISTKVMIERDTGRSKGFGFVEMGSDSEASAAIEGMNGQPLGGRSLLVNEARPMEPRPPRTGGYGGGSQAQNSGGYAGRNEGSFRSPYGTGPRNRQNTGHGSINHGGGTYRND